MKVNRVLFLLFVMITVFCCRKSYQPAEIIVNYGYLVVEGVINTGTNAITIINLTRTKNLGDTSRKTNAELRAKITIEADGGATYTLLETGNGAYQSAALNLNATLKYRLRIVTNNGSTYLSDLVQAKQTPAIDSVTWKQDKGVTVSVHTHDPQNKTIYYRWEFDETWQYRSFQQASLGVKNGLIFYRDSITQVYNCWGTEHSTNILTASSAVLAKDVISYAPLKYQSILHTK